MTRPDARPVLEYHDPEMRHPVIVQRIRGTQYSLIAGCQTIQLTRTEAVHVALAILRDADVTAPDR